MASKTKRTIKTKNILITTQSRYLLRKRATKKTNQPKVLKVKASALRKTKKITKKSKKLRITQTIKSKKVIVKKPIQKVWLNPIKRVSKLATLGKRTIKLPDVTFVQNMLSSLKLKCQKPKHLRSKNKKPSLSKAKFKSVQRSKANSLRKKAYLKQPQPIPTKQLSKPPIRNKKIKIIAQPKKKENQSYDSNTVENISPTLPKLNKQYIGKSILQIEKQRYQKTRLYLVKGEKRQVKNQGKSEWQWDLHVAQHKGKVYIVSIDCQNIRCNCIHFRLNRNKCEDIKFIVTKIIQNQEITFHLKFKSQITEEIFDKIDQQLSKRLSFYLPQPASQTTAETKLDLNCFVCFDQLQNQAVSNCQGCSTKFHKKCFQIYKKTNENCLFCKNAYKGNGQKQDIAEMVEQINA